MKLSKIKYLLSLALVPLLFVACDSEDDPVTSTMDPQTANVKVIHASPDAPAVDLLVDDNIAGSGLAFPNNTGYLTVDAGTRNVKVNVSGTSTTVINANLDLVANNNYSVFAIGEVSSITALVLNDNLADPANGKAHVRFVHLSPDAPAVDITLTDGTIVFENVAFGEYVDFTPLDAASYPLQVRAAGTDTVVLDLGSITLDDGKIYTVFAKGFADASTSPDLGAEIIVNK